MGDADWKTKIDAAHRMVTALCQPRGSAGTREWVMSIPARPDYDPDLVIAAGLRAAEAEVDRLRGLLARFTVSAPWIIPHLPTGWQCRHCRENWDYGRPDRHTADCIVLLARKALAPTP